MNATPRVLVTGGGGRLGRHVVARLAAEARVTVLDRVPVAVAGADRVVVADVLDAGGLADAFAGHDAVIHLAGLDLSANAGDDVFFHVNAAGAWNALSAAERAGVGRVVAASSVAATGLSAGQPPRALPVSEDHPLLPADGYGLAKQTLEHACACFARRGLVTRALRPAYVMFADVLPHVAAAVAAEDADVDAPAPPLAVVEPLSRSRAWVRPDDCAEAFARATLAADADTPFAVWNVVADDGFGPAPTLANIRRLFGRLPPDVEAARYARSPRASVFCNRRIGAALGWRATGDWWQWLAENDIRAESR